MIARLPCDVERDQLYRALNSCRKELSKQMTLNRKMAEVIANFAGDCGRDFIVDFDGLDAQGVIKKLSLELELD